ncbi:hypothetical protein GCM10010517_50040 [Streptosporangium fragile]|uniref:DSBA-like thioredoxin domain-containing protein n=2 Tax=Streptosporangium fragile TaxID=46186 RepID=A0ABN3W3Y2_9ACTN
MEVWADLVCAWAYIGKRRMEKAGFGEDVEIVWRPYVIDPMAPTPSEPLEEALRDPVAEGALRACAPDLTPAENRARVARIATEEGIGAGGTWTLGESVGAGGTRTLGEDPLTRLWDDSGELDARGLAELAARGPAGLVAQGPAEPAAQGPAESTVRGLGRPDARGLAGLDVRESAGSGDRGSAGPEAQGSAGAGGPGWGPAWRANTFDAHRVVALAYERGGAALQDAVVERILRAHFVEAADIGDRVTLAALAAEAGLDGMAEALDRGEGAAEVRSQLLRGKAAGVATSPTFVVGDTAVAGAQPPDVLADLVRNAAPQRELPDEVRLLRQAESLLDARDPLGALRTLEPLLAEHGDDPSVRLLAARAYFGSAQLGRARQALESLLERAPGDHYARFLLGRTLERANRHAEALPHLRLAAAMSPDPAYTEAVRRVENRVS